MNAPPSTVRIGELHRFPSGNVYLNGWVIGGTPINALVIARGHPLCTLERLWSLDEVCYMHAHWDEWQETAPPAAALSASWITMDEQMTEFNEAADEGERGEEWKAG